MVNSPFDIGSVDVPNPSIDIRSLVDYYQEGCLKLLYRNPLPGAYYTLEIFPP